MCRCEVWTHTWKMSSISFSRLDHSDARNCTDCPGAGMTAFPGPPPEGQNRRTTMALHFTSRILSRHCSELSGECVCGWSGHCREKCPGNCQGEHLLSCLSPFRVVCIICRSALTSSADATLRLREAVRPVSTLSTLLTNIPRLWNTCSAVPTCGRARCS